jgi:hypothetical protein
MKTIGIILILVASPLTNVQAGGHGGSRHSYGGAWNGKLTYAFPKASHYQYRPFNPRSY